MAVLLFCPHFRSQRFSAILVITLVNLSALHYFFPNKLSGALSFWNMENWSKTKPLVFSVFHRPNLWSPIIFVKKATNFPNLSTIPTASKYQR